MTETSRCPNCHREFPEPLSQGNCPSCGKPVVAGGPITDGAADLPTILHTVGPKQPVNRRPIERPVRRWRRVIDRNRDVRLRSSTRVLGIPLVDIAFGRDREKGETFGHAKGIFAWGDRSTDVFACGGFARGFVAFGKYPIGFIAIGICPVGIISLGMIAGGLVFASGGLAISGYVAFGAVAIGYQSVGLVAIGIKAAGACMWNPIA